MASTPKPVRKIAKKRQEIARKAIKHPALYISKDKQKPMIKESKKVEKKIAKERHQKNK